MQPEKDDDVNTDAAQCQVADFAAQLAALWEAGQAAPESIPVAEVTPASADDVETFFGDLH